MGNGPSVSDDDMVARMGRAWRDLRRGATTAVLRDLVFGVGSDAIEPGHMDVLDLLVQRGRCRMSELAAALRVDPSTVTRTLQRMEAAGLARRLPSTSGDRRAVLVTITTIGRERHSAVAVRRATMLTEIMGRFSDNEQERLVELLERFIESADLYVAQSSRLGASALP